MKYIGMLQVCSDGGNAYEKQKMNNIGTEEERSGVERTYEKQKLKNIGTVEECSGVRYTYGK